MLVGHNPHALLFNIPKKGSSFITAYGTPRAVTLGSSHDHVHELHQPIANTRSTPTDHSKQDASHPIAKQVPL